MARQSANVEEIQSNAGVHQVNVLATAVQRQKLSQLLVLTRLLATVEEMTRTALVSKANVLVRDAANRWISLERG
jgi:hypothetical protein